MPTSPIRSAPIRNQAGNHRRSLLLRQDHLANRLMIQLRVNGRAGGISLDNYFVDQDLTPRDESGDYDFEALEALQLELFNEHLSRLIAGEVVESAL